MKGIEGLGLLAALATAGEERGGGSLQADFLKHDSNEAGMEHARRLASLKPGDEIYWKAKDRDPVKAYFIGFDGGRATLIHYDVKEEDGNPWCIGAHPYPCLRFADQL